MIGRLLANRYRIVEHRGTGGMAIVYRAIDENTGHDVAVKVLRPDLAADEDYVTRFQREAVAASRMTHHNIVNLIDVGLDGDVRFLVMEYVSGKTLKDLIKERGQLSPRVATEITIRILSALQHAHDNGIIHRDIKPQNILVQDDGIVKVTDFGIARIADSVTLTKGDVVMGSVHYLSPEQASGHPVDARTDIYSVGVVLYEMLTGRVPFDGENQVAIAMKHIHNMPPPIESLAPDVPQSLIAVCMKALNKHPEYRYQTASSMAQDLRLVMDGQLVIGPREDEAPVAGLAKNAPEKEGGRKKSRVNWPWWVFTVITMVLVFSGIYFGASSIYDNVVNSAEVPYMIGLDLASATKAAQKVNLLVETIEINHPNVPAGSVVMQAPAEGTVMKKGDTVVLTISTGPTSIECPRVVGMTQQNAMSLALEMGLSLTVVERVTSSEVQSGFVMSQTPEAGEMVKAGDTIQVTVSGGLAIVPDLVGKPFPEARSLLTRSGLTLADEIQFVATQDPELHNLVISQSLASGLQVNQGTEVNLGVYQVASMTYAVSIDLQLPESSSAQQVRVTLVSDGSEYMVYQGEFPPDSIRDPEIQVFSQEAGQFVIRVYIDRMFAYQQEVTME